MLNIFPLKVLLSLLSITIAQGLMVAFLPLYATNIHESPFFVGGLYSSYFLGVVLGSFKTEKWLSKIKGDSLTVMLLAILVCLSVAMSLFQSALSWVVFRFFVGVVTGGCYILAELYALTTPSKHRRSALAVYFCTLYGGMTIGALLLNLYSSSTEIDPQEASLYFLTCILFQAIAIVLNLLIKFPNTTSEDVQEPLFATFKKIITPVIIASMGGALVGSASAHMPGFGRVMGFSLQYTSVLVSIAIIGGACMCVPAAWLANKRGDIRSTLIVMVFGVMSDLFISLFDVPEIGPVFVVVLFAIGSGMPLYMLALSRASLDSSSTSQFVRFAAILGVSFATGAIIGPLYAGFFVVLTAKGLFVSNVTIKTAVIIFLLLSPELRKKTVYGLNRDGKVMDAGLSIIFAGLARRSVGKKMRKRIDKKGKKG